MELELASPDSTIRRVALMDLADAGDEAHVPLFVAALGDSAAEVRLEAARALEAFEGTAAVAALAEALRDSDAAVRTAAAQALAELKDPASAAALLPHAGDLDPFVLVAVLRALRELRVEASYAPACAALAHPQAAVRREAIAVLGYLKREQAVPRRSPRAGCSAA
jgi:HEAT repeat protein